jgi:hypothetical protein
MSSSPSLSQMGRHKRIAEAGSLFALLDEKDGEAILRQEASDASLPESEKIITSESQVDLLLALRSNHLNAETKLGLFFSTDDVLIVPGFMGCSLRDVGGQHGLIWINPSLLINAGQLDALKLSGFKKGIPDQDSEPGVKIESNGAIPAIYDLLAADLNLRRYDAQVFSFDWRKDIERSAMHLADRVRERLGRKPRPLHLIAHSQGTIVARRAIQMLGAEQARRLVNNLVLLGPATFGTFSAALALAGTHESLSAVRKFGVELPEDFKSVLQSFTGLYQLLPWDKNLFPNGFDPGLLKSEDFKQKTGSEPDRLGYGFGWAKLVDTTFFNDRTTIILGDQKTIGAVGFDASNRLVARGELVDGDGTVPDFLARLPGVRTFRAAGADHMTLPMHLGVMAAVRSILRGDSPALNRLGLATDKVPLLASPTVKRSSARATLAASKIGPKARPRPTRREPPAPPCRKLRVFSFDPLLATRVDTLEISTITLKIPWEADGQLGEGPVGEYVEVVDYDPSSRCFYAPVDLTHPRLAAQEGLPPSESDPQFHQQMTYAVAMSTIVTFEKALGRVALWAPHLERDEDGEVIPTPHESQYVPRLRIYPHAFRDANAYYDPDRHALLFGYFPSRDQPGGSTMPGGTVFSCQSFDIIAHETTHALLHGLHRYYLEPSNPDVLAFHEAFADAVAIFQHFSHIDVVHHQIAKTRGDLKSENLLGELAQQFGSAIGEHRGALRQYIQKEPDPSLYRTATDPHDRGAILMAALFLSFQKIYEQRAKDLYRIATGGTGKLPDGDIHPDLVTRLSIEASKSARHILTMCVRALDYVPPVDLTFGEYIRALITADYDLVKDDDRGYRVSVIDASRSWGLYPADVNVLDEPALLWQPPEGCGRDALREAVGHLSFTVSKPRSDRRLAFLQMQDNVLIIRKWLYEHGREMGDGGESLGLFLFGQGLHSIPRNDRNSPKFEVHSIRRCLRIGPDGEPRIDLVAEIVQRRAGFYEEAVQETVDASKEPWAYTRKDREASKKSRKKLPGGKDQPDFWFRGGCTLIIDPSSGEIRYVIKKCIRSKSRFDRERDFRQRGAFSSAAAIYFGTRNRNPFAMLHSEE